MSTERTAADRLLAHKAAIGDKSAMKEIYSLHVRYLTAVCSRYVVNTEDVKDILQDTFVKIFGSISGFKPSTEGSLRSWMTRITVNETLQFIRRKQRLMFTDLPDDDNSPAEPPPPDCDAISTDRIYDEIRRLPDGYRTIFNLFAIEGLSHKDIASMLGITPSTSASQFHRAKHLLASRLSNIDQSTPSKSSL